MKKLIINADDFGYCPKRNQGIIDCFIRGGITSATLLINASYAQNAVELARECSLPLGLHFNITEGKPVSTQSINNLICPTSGSFRGKFGQREALDGHKIEDDEIALELIAQIEKFIQLVGKKPTHVDGHHHIHVHPHVVFVFACVLNKFDIKFTRLPLENEEFFNDFSQENSKFYKEIILNSLRAEKIFKSKGINYTSGYLGMSIMGERMNAVVIKLRLEVLFQKCDSIEIMCHPGYCSEAFIGGCDPATGPDEFSQSADREWEWSVLTGSCLSDFYKDNAIILKSF